MGRSRNLSKLLVDSNGDVDAASLDNVPPSDDASALTTGTLAVARLPNEGQSLGMRNRIINGDMRIDQRNAGASKALSASVTDYTLDRWQVVNATNGALSVQQVASGPAGFTNSLKVTVTAADASIDPSADQIQVRQMIEGFNLADLGWGTADAKSITLSFKAISSLTGTFSGSIANAPGNRCYVFSYTIDAANTWENKQVVIPGDTSGTWFTDSGVGCRVRFCLTAGSDLVGTPGSWGSTNLTGATGQVQFVSTNGATWQITGVQLEVGSVATPFERRPYGTELALCQRYFQVIQNTGAGGGVAVGDGGFIQLAAYNTTEAYGGLLFQQTMRSSPTITLSDTESNTFVVLSNNNAGDCDFFLVTNTSAQRAELSFSSVNNYTGGYAVWVRIKPNKSVYISAEL